MLITIAEQQEIKPISANWAAMAKLNGGTTHFEQLVQDVQDMKLPKLLGYALYQDVVKNPTSVNNVVLLDGGSFEDSNGNLIDFKGIKYQLAWFNFQRYVEVSNFSDTSTGMRTKTAEKSQPLRDGMIKREQTFSENKAMQDFELMKLFLIENSDTYPLFDCTKEKNTSSVNIYNIRKTLR